jgi:hypothetical protein
MKSLIPLLVIPFAQPAMANELIVRINVSRFCATVVGIPYASNNFTDEEFMKFLQCVKFVRKFDGID